MAEPQLVAGFCPVTGGGSADPRRNASVERYRAASVGGSAGIGTQAADLPRTVVAGLDVDGTRTVLADTGVRSSRSRSRSSS